MITQDLIEYVKTGLAVGTDIEAIKSELRGKGFANDEIDQAFITARSGKSTNPSNDANGWHLSRKEVYIGLGTLIILASAILIFYFSHNPHGGTVLGSFIK